MIKTLLFLFMAALGFSCSIINRPITYFVDSIEEADTSLIVKNERVGMTDTTTAFLSGRVLMKETGDSLSNAILSLRNMRLHEQYNVATDSTGYFSISVPPDEYLFQVQYWERTTLSQQITLIPGEMRSMEIKLGQGRVMVSYIIRSYRKLDDEELDERVETIRQVNKQSKQ